MSESGNLPLNFGGIGESSHAGFDRARVLIFPIAYQKELSGAAAIIDASRKLELYDEETDAEVYKIGIHTLAAAQLSGAPAEMTKDLLIRAKELLKADKFLCLIGGEPSVSAPIIEAHAGKFHDLSIFQIAAHADLRDESGGTPRRRTGVMARLVKDLRLPAVQAGIRSLSAEEAHTIAGGVSTKIYYAKDIIGSTDWIDAAAEHLTDTVYLTINADGLDPSVMPAVAAPEPGGFGWHEILTIIRKLAEKKRIVGMDLVGFSPPDQQIAPAYLCAKLIYKTLGYIFRGDTPPVSG